MPKKINNEPVKAAVNAVLDNLFQDDWEDHFEATVGQIVALAARSAGSNIDVESLKRDLRSERSKKKDPLSELVKDPEKAVKKRGRPRKVDFPAEKVEIKVDDSTESS